VGKVLKVKEVIRLAERDCDKIGLDRRACGEVKIIFGGFIWHLVKLFVPKWAEGITLMPLGGIYLFPRSGNICEDFNDNALRGFVMVCHELVHVRQVMETSFWEIRYLLDFIARFLKTKRFRDAYASISFEIEAYKISKEIQEDIVQTRRGSVELLT